MEKPKITEGEWFPIEYSGYLIIQDEDNYGGLNLLDRDHFPLAENNAKAMSAAPKMIDALIDARKALKTAKSDYSNRGLVNHRVNDSLIEIEQALKKAGCAE